jgi:hypothetical protein
MVLKTKCKTTNIRGFVQRLSSQILPPIFGEECDRNCASTRCVSDANVLLLPVGFLKLQMAACSVFLFFFFEINSAFHPVFDRSICGQETGNVTLILIVPNAVFGVKTCYEISNQMLMFLYCLDLMG